MITSEQFLKVSKYLPVFGFFCREKVGRVVGCEMVWLEGLIRMSVSRDPEPLVHKVLAV